MDAQVTSERLRRSVNALEHLHAVIIGLALTLGAQGFMSPWLGSGAVGSERSHFPLTPFLLFMALFITIIPFFHGATRHLDAVHLSGARPPSRDLLIDYFLLFLEGVAFVSMGMSVYSPTHFFWAAAVVLTIDTVWGVNTLLRSGERRPYLLKWLLLDVGTGASLVALWRWIDPAAFGGLMCAGALIRTVIDYWLNWDFFFDRETEAGGGAVTAAPIANAPANGAPAGDIGVRPAAPGAAEKAAIVKTEASSTTGLELVPLPAKEPKK